MHINFSNLFSTSVPNPQGTESGVIDEKIFLNGNGNSTHAANISWNAQRWFESHQIEFFDVLIEERPDTSRYYYIFDVPARDKVSGNCLSFVLQHTGGSKYNKVYENSRVNMMNRKY
jgi:hypothetical protein